MALLLSYSQQQAIKPISANNEGKYAQLAAEVEEKELRSLLGVALLQDIQSNPTSTNNVLLLDGDEFEDCYGNTITHKGIRYLLAYLNYSRYIWESDISDTFTGFVVKNRQESEMLTDGRRKSLQLTMREIAMQEWILIKDYLDEKYANFTLWNYGNETKKPYTPRIYGVRKTGKTVYYDKVTRQIIR